MRGGSGVGGGGGRLGRRGERVSAVACRRRFRLLLWWLSVESVCRYGRTDLSIMVINGATSAPAEAAAAASATSLRPSLSVLYPLSLTALGSSASLDLPVTGAAFFHGRTSLASAGVAMTCEGCILVVAELVEPASAPLMIIWMLRLGPREHWSVRREMLGAGCGVCGQSPRDAVDWIVDKIE